MKQRALVELIGREILDCYRAGRKASGSAASVSLRAATIRAPAAAAQIAVR